MDEIFKNVFQKRKSNFLSKLNSLTKMKLLEQCVRIDLLIQLDKCEMIAENAVGIRGMRDAGFKANYVLLNSSCSGQSHGSRILQIRHDNCRDGKHKTRHDLLGIVVQFRVGERDAGAVNGHPGRPLQTQHQGTHAEDHPQNVHVVRHQVVIGIGRTAIGVATSIGIRYCLRQN